MYFIMQGDCVVNIRDMAGKLLIAFKLLAEGDIFGEIGLVYLTKRTSTVISRSYSTLAELNYDNFKTITTDYPEMMEYTVKKVMKYKDPRLQFMKRALSKLEFLKEIPRDCFFEIMFDFKAKSINTSETLLSESQTSSSLFIVESGCLDVYTSFEGNEFIIDYLHSGAIINFRNFILDEPWVINIRAKQFSTVLRLKLSHLEAIQQVWPQLKRQMLMYQH